MNISNLVNHFNFNKIFSECKNEKNQIDWLKVAVYPNLPVNFIDRYFYKLKTYQIERYQTFDDYIISKYKNSINWYLLLSNQKISLTAINENIDIIKKFNLWSYVLRFQDVDIKFIKDNIEYLKSNEKLKNLAKATCELLKVKDGTYYSLLEELK